MRLWSLVLLAACERDPEASPIGEQQKYAGCSVVDTLGWLQPEGQGYVGWVAEYTYDELGWLETAWVDNEVDADFAETYDRRADGTYDRYTLDWGPDGAIDESETWDYGGDDLADAREYRLELEDRIRERSTFLNGGGLRLEERVDLEGDDLVDVVTSYRYDDLDRVVQLATDLTGDGEPEHLQSFAYLRDTELLVGMELDEWSDGLAEQIDIYTYDEEDRLTGWFVEFPEFEFTFDLTYAYLDPDAPYDELDQEVRERGELVQTAHQQVRHDAERRLLEEVTTYTVYPVVTVSTATRKLEWTCP